MPESGDSLKDRVKTDQREPPRFSVVLLNDDYTTMEFVMQVLESIFQRSPAEAYQIMMHVHLNGRGWPGSIHGRSPKPRWTTSWLRPGAPGFRSRPWRRRTERRPTGSWAAPSTPVHRAGDGWRHSARCPL